MCGCRWQAARLPLPNPSTRKPHVPHPSLVLRLLLPQIMEDMHRVFDTGYFSLCKPMAEETRDGIKFTLEVGWAEGASHSRLLQARLPQALRRR